jgi:ABC-type transporter Mla subunit MlaD
MTNNHENLTEKHSECAEQNKGRFGQMEEMILHLNQQVSVLIAESNDLKRLFKKGIDLANNVKRRVALTTTSEEVEKILGRKEEKELRVFF